MIAGCVLFDEIVNRKEFALSSANIIKWLENRFEVERHGSETSSFEVKIEFHVLFRVVSRFMMF
jgi:hypothetical protein